ncbi:BON domain-containing protein [Lampropedia aestuarii]|uniref:BON domain-containing protein n=1 Tax=Lampropedia aestuarii TaxID=2562762 RepID=A0A4S5BNI6_9BURK|nr:BON domain-containing protein [Lampropedia aestuarii]
MHQLLTSWRISVSVRQLAMAGLLGASLAMVSGCAVVRDQQSVGEYIDDAGITIAVKARLADNPATSAIAISVETFNGVVHLSGFAKSEQEKQRATQIAAETLNVRSVQNNLVVKP